jgi:type VI secretion system protein ImpL
MSLKMFSNYFGPNGIFEGFFKTYLSPFIDDSEMPWKIINVDNATLPISQDTMRFFESLRTIQTLYYDSKTKDMAVYFTLQPVAFSQNLYAVSFQLGDQFCTFSKLSPNKLCTFTWPDQINSNLLLITLTDTKGNRSFSKEIGPWSLIKLFSHTERTSDIGKLQVSISKDNLTANLLLITERNNDPFTFDVFRNIKFPQQL